MALQPEVCSGRCESSKCSTLHVLASSSTRRITPLQTGHSNRSRERAARAPVTSSLRYPPLARWIPRVGLRTQCSGRPLFEIRSRGCVPLPMSRTWPGLPPKTRIDSEEPTDSQHLWPTAIHRVPPPLDGSSSRTARGCCTSYRTGFASFRTGPDIDPPFLTDRRAPSCSRCAVCTPRRSISRSAAAAGQPHLLPCDRSTRATRCACPLDVSTSSRPCSAKRSRPPVLRFRNRSGVDSFHGFLCSRFDATCAATRRA